MAIYKMLTRHTGLLCQITRTLKFTPVGACSLALVFSDITGPLVRIKLDEQGNLEEGYGYFQIDKEIRTIGSWFKRYN